MIPNRLKAEGDGEKVLRRRCRKSKMLMLADTNSGRRSAITGRHKWSGRALTGIGEKVRPFSEMGHPFLLEALLDRVAGRSRGMRDL